MNMIENGAILLTDMQSIAFRLHDHNIR